MSEIETRAFEARADLEERTIVGLAVPYGQTADIGGMYQERFAPGAIASIEDVKLFYGHEEPIGKVVEGRDTEAGFEIIAKLTEGVQRADEVLALMRDGVLNKFSVGFIPEESQKDGSTITRTKVSLKEVSVVPFPAFAGANITEVREEQTAPEAELTNEQEMRTMSENMELEVRSVMDEVAELRRVVEAGLTPSAPAAIASEIRSQAEFAKALLKGDEDAKALARAASDSGDAALLPAFIGYVDTLINNNRPTVSAFSRTPLPTSGLTVEYAQIDSNTLAVGQQDPENEALSFGNLTFETITAPVKTYGGYTSFSRQYVERANINTLNEVFRGLSLAYANTTNTSLVTYLAGLTWTGKVFDADGGTPSSLAEGIANATAYIYVNSGLRPEFILTGTDGYVKLAKVAATDGRLALSANGDGSNTVGAVNIPGLSGQVFGLPIIVDPAIGTGDVYLANSSAIATHESAGAPVRLTDGDITTLTDSVSVYGYMAITAPRLGAIVKLDVTA